MICEGLCQLMLRINLKATSNAERQKSKRRSGEVMIRKRAAKIADAKSKTEAMVKCLRVTVLDYRTWNCTEPVH